MVFCAFISLLSFFIIPLVQHACAGKHKERIPIHMSISDRLPNGIMSSPSLLVEGGQFYYVKRPIMNKFRMGAIMEGGAVILPGCNRDLDRFIFLAYINNKIYIRIVAKFLDRLDQVQRKVYELVREQSNPRFTQLVRDLVNLDLLAQEFDPKINVYADAATMTRRFCIKSEFNIEAVIGVVTYGGQTILRANSGLLNRNVILEFGKPRHKIIILSTYNDGNCVKSGFRDTGDERGFVLDEMITRPLFLHPRDEDVTIT
ncbi:signal peptide-containing protein [Theileria equi strain WA]|uniref:Signal peptide-containing protein n=1 Tax=Theileria equi strain WA TaxID=1537102 RepID=L0AYR7_THEEQ|nr:signal peptide-containing protein [Theileria equi strain WA]AFZ80166.1 signal peptide-containing protein [Theileria equi strain WA]|eukprot:XP_004829832.1 signal peptide-containing protein [Theileria equi strain WA]